MRTSECGQLTTAIVGTSDSGEEPQQRKKKKDKVKRKKRTPPKLGDSRTHCKRAKRKERDKALVAAAEVMNAVQHDDSELVGVAN